MTKFLILLASIVALLFYDVKSFSVGSSSAFFHPCSRAVVSKAKPLSLHPDQASELVNAAEAELKEHVKQRAEDDLAGSGTKKQKQHNGGGVSGALWMAEPKARSILSYLFPSSGKTDKST